MARPKKDTRTLEEKIQDRLDYDLNELRKDHYPEPAIQFEIGEKVIWGAHPNAEVIESVDNGKFLLIRTWGDYNDRGNLVYSENRTWLAWTRPDKFRSPLENSQLPVFSRKDDIQIQYSQRDVSSLVNTMYHAGIDMSPDYQRGNVWTMEDKQELIKSIFNNVDIGKFVIIKTENWQDCYYEMLDGKQRLTALAEFLENRFPVDGYYYQDLSWQDQNHIENFPISYGEISKGITQKQKYEYFLRLNTRGKIVDPEHIEYVKRLYEKEKEQ